MDSAEFLGAKLLLLLLSSSLLRFLLEDLRLILEVFLDFFFLSEWKFGTLILNYRIRSYYEFSSIRNSLGKDMTWLTY